MIRVVCGCGRVFKAEDRHTGKRTRCPACGANLVIGQTPVSSSSEDLDELPSWWYPSVATEPPRAEGVPSSGQRDPEAVPTAVIESGLAAAGPLPGLAGAGPAARTRSSGRIWTTTSALAVVGLVALGVIYWLHAHGGGPGDAMAARPPRGGVVPRDSGPGEIADRGESPAAHGGRVARPVRRLRLLVPAYIYPSPEGRKQWLRLLDASSKVDLVVVVNPDSGPGAKSDLAYASVIAEAVGRGVRLIGYVSMKFGARPLTEIKEEIDTWLRFYPRIGGFFFDQQPPDAVHAASFAELGTYARGKVRDALVIGNPGGPCDEAYLSRRAADVVCVFARPEGFDSFELPSALKGYAPSHIAAISYQVAGAATMRGLLEDAIIKRIGYVYITDGKMLNPWGQLPTYWDDEVDAVMRLQ